MEWNDFLEKFSEQFDDTEVDMFTPDTKFRDLEEWSSLITLSIIAMVDEEYDIQIKGEEIQKAITINELYEIVKSKE